MVWWAHVLLANVFLSVIMRLHFVNVVHVVLPIRFGSMRLLILNRVVRMVPKLIIPDLGRDICVIELRLMHCISFYLRLLVDILIMNDALALAQLLKQLKRLRRMLQLIQSPLHMYFLDHIMLDLAAKFLRLVVPLHFQLLVLVVLWALGEMGDFESGEKAFIMIKHAALFIKLFLNLVIQTLVHRKAQQLQLLLLEILFHSSIRAILLNIIELHPVLDMLLYLSPRLFMFFMILQPPLLPLTVKVSNLLPESFQRLVWVAGLKIRSCIKEPWTIRVQGEIQIAVWILHRHLVWLYSLLCFFVKLLELLVVYHLILPTILTFILKTWLIGCGLLHLYQILHNTWIPRQAWCFATVSIILLQAWVTSRGRPLLIHLILRLLLLLLLFHLLLLVTQLPFLLLVFYQPFLVNYLPIHFITDIVALNVLRPSIKLLLEQFVIVAKLNILKYLDVRRQRRRYLLLSHFYFGLFIGTHNAIKSFVEHFLLSKRIFLVSKSVIVAWVITTHTNLPVLSSSHVLGFPEHAVLVHLGLHLRHFYRC